MNQGTAVTVLDFDIQKFTRKCAKTDRELAPGESFYSVLVSEGADVVRYDYSLPAWDGPPENSLGYWRSSVPDPKANKMKLAPNDVLLHYFVCLEDQAEKQDVRYILALLMIRKRILRLDDQTKDADGNEQLLVYCPKNETEYAVPVINPTQERAAQIQSELASLLYAEGTSSPSGR
ncbi:MAG: hypothetical protein R3C28_16570 [Pirellulaceae bacterium]